MQRLLENHSGDQEFSQARLLDEDASMKNDLRTMKAGLSRKRQLSSGSSASNIVAHTKVEQIKVRTYEDMLQKTVEHT